MELVYSLRLNAIYIRNLIFPSTVIITLTIAERLKVGYVNFWQRSIGKRKTNFLPLDDSTDGIKTVYVENSIKLLNRSHIR